MNLKRAVILLQLNELHGDTDFLFSAYTGVYVYVIDI